MGYPLEQINAGGSVSYYHEDQLGSVRAITDGSGSVNAAYTYDAYGNLTSPPSLFTNPFGFAGQYQDAESGLYYLRARFYDPVAGQFTSRDPAIASTHQPYSYVSDNPLNATDPQGLCSWAPWDSNSCESVIVGGAMQLPGAVVGDVSQGVSTAENALHQNAPMIADFGHGMAAICGTGALLSVAVGAAPVAAVTGGCAVVGSLVAAVADADMAAPGDPGHHWGDVGWDMLGAIPDFGLERSVGQAVNLGRAWRAAKACRKAYVALRNQEEMWENISWALAITSEVGVIHNASHFLMPSIFK